MTGSIGISKSVLEIAGELLTFYQEHYEGSSEVSIFLCGGSSREQYRYRKQLGHLISAKTSKYKYTVHYAEELFADLLYGRLDIDLLELENILAEAVSSIVILLESPGTFAELGAFTQHLALTKKLIVVLDEKYKKSKSFINYGPIRQLKHKSKARILSRCSQRELAQEISNKARKMARDFKPRLEIGNPISSRDFYLALIHIFGPISQQRIVDISFKLSTAKKKLHVEGAVATILNYLHRQRFISGSTDLSISDVGTDKLIWKDRTERSRIELYSQLSGFRVRALNSTYRKHNRWSVTV